MYKQLHVYIIIIILLSILKKIQIGLDRIVFVNFLNILRDFFQFIKNIQSTRVQQYIQNPIKKQKQRLFFFKSKKAGQSIITYTVNKKKILAPRPFRKSQD